MTPILDAPGAPPASASGTTDGSPPDAAITSVSASAATASSTPRLTDETHRLVHRGLALRVRRLAAVSGDPSAPQPPGRDVVLVHGLGLSSEYLERLARALTSVGPVHLLDLPGFGGVPRPARTPSVTDLAGLVDAWVVSAGLRDPVLLGQSLGTQVVVEMLAARPGVARHAVLVGLSVDPAGRTAAAQLGRFARSAPFESRTRRIAAHAYLRAGVPWIARVLKSTLEYRTEDRLPAVAASLLLVRGTQDRICPPGWMSRAAVLAPRARAAEVAGTGHLVVHDRADEVAALVMSHIGR